METLDKLLTEQIDSRYAQLDTASIAQLATMMNEAEALVPQAVKAALPQIVPAISAISQRMARGGRLIYVGAGTAGRLGVLDAAECQPTFNVAPGLVRAIIAGGDRAVFRSAEGAEDDRAAAAVAIIEHEVSQVDSVVGVAASGRTPFVLGAMEAARQRGALTVGVSCNENTLLSAAAELPIEVLVGPEVLAGSTRLKAGTAQKMVLNMISTIAMVKQGKAYGNLMVDMRVTNSKLRERAVRIIQHVTMCTRAVAEAALVAADSDVKTAIVSIAGASTAEAARQRLAASGGRLREALESAI